MFFRTFATVLSLTILAAAIPSGENFPKTTIAITPRGSHPPGECSTGPVECCNVLKDASDPVVAKELGALGFVPGSVTGLVGMDCNSAMPGATCASTTVCCQNNNVGGLMSIGCVPMVL